MKGEKIKILASLLKQQEELIKEGIILIQGAKVSVQGQSDDDIFQILLQNYPKSTRRFEILYKRFSFLHQLQKKRIARLKKAPEKDFEEERKCITCQNRLFMQFCQRALKDPTPQVSASLGKGICLGVTLDLAAKKIAGKPAQAVIRPTMRGRRLQQKYINCRLATIKKLHEFYRELGEIHFDAPVRYFKLYEILCQKWAKVFESLDKKAKREFLKAKKIFEKKKLPGNRRNLLLYKKFFRKVNEYALQLVEKVPDNLGEDLGLKIVPIVTSGKVSTETFIRNLKVFMRKFRKQSHAILEFQNDIEKSHHGVYCSFSPPYELHDANFPGFRGFCTNDLSEFKLFLCFWSCFYTFSSFKALYQVKNVVCV